MSSVAIPGLPPSKIQLLRAGELLAEVALVDQQEWLLGSGESADLRVQHSTVDAAHARLFLGEGEVFIEDLGSHGGTFVRGRRVQSPVKLIHRDQILLGQHYVVKPLVVRYFDAAAHVLEDLGLVERPAGGPPGEPGGSDVSRRTDLPARRTVSTAKPGDAAAMEGADKAKARVGRMRQLLRRAWKPLALLAGGAVAVALALSLLQPSAAIWREVRISPTVVSAGDELVLSGQDIRPHSGLQIHIGGRSADIRDSRRGRLSIRVPALSDRPAGSYDVPLVVRTGRIEAYQLMLRYVVRPQVDRVAPLPVEVGSRLSILGSGLADEPEDIHVRFGETEVPVLSATASEVVVQVPVLTRARPVRVAIEVAVVGELASLAEPLEVIPRQPRPLDFGFGARFAESRGAWELHTLFGPVFYLPAEEGEEPADGEVPLRIRRLANRWRRAVDQARSDPEFQVSGAALTAGGCRLSGAARGGSDGLQLGLWEGESLIELMAPGREELSDAMLCQWFAGIWNQFLQVFARGEPIETGGPLAQYARVLNHLVERNRASGGDGRPELSEVEELSVEQREHLRRAFLPVPRDLGSVAGRWRIELENVFGGDDPDVTYVIDVELTQRAGRLTGEASSAVVRSGIEIGFGMRNASGRLQLGAPTRVTIQIPLSGPIGTIELRGVLEGGRLGGRFETGGGASGTWTATRR